MHTFKAKAPYTGTIETVEKLVQPGASGEVRFEARPFVFFFARLTPPMLPWELSHIAADGSPFSDYGLIFAQSCGGAGDAICCGDTER